MPAYDVVLKKIEPQMVASIREVVPTYADVGRQLNKLFPYIMRSGARTMGMGMAVYYDPEYRERDVDVEVALPVTASIAGTDRIKVHELPGIETAACLVHQGSYDTLSQTYGALMKWIEENDYKIAGPNREIYLQHSDDDPSACMTEVQIPVEKGS